ncbi:MAG: peptidase S8 [Chloroflexota bacterium]|nr:MAG: peptidase S8 [Chloroflexota bacterium]
MADDGTIPGKYIVVLRDQVQDVDSEADRLAGKHGLARDDEDRQHVYYAAVRGFAARMSAVQAAALAKEPSVAFVSPDRVVRAIGKPGGGTAPQPAQVVPDGIARVGANGLSNTGTGIGVAVIDTGIDLTHPDLQSNIAGDVTFVRRTKSGNDDNGHGTHVAGTIAALNNGIGVVGMAPQAKLYAVKVLDRNGNGTWSSVIAGVDWVAQRAGTIRVANMSLSGYGTSDNNCGKTNQDALHQAICGARDKGVTFVVAAGNSATDASTSAPASYKDAVITVSALADSDGKPGHLGLTTSSGADDTFAAFSNFGSVVDIAAPGVDIYSTWKGGTYGTISGTSMATPHVTGAAALYIRSQLNAGVSPNWTQIRDALIAAGYPQGSLDGFTGDPDVFHEPLLYAGGL